MLAVITSLTSGLAVAQPDANQTAFDCPLADRNAAIELFRASVVNSMSDSSLVVVYSPQTMVGPDDIVVDGLTRDTLFSGPVSSWLFWVDTEPLARFAHPTSFYLVEQATCNIVGPIAGTGWPRVNSLSYYMGDDRYTPADTAWVGQIYRQFFQAPVPMPPDRGERFPWPTILASFPEDGSICLVIVDGMNTTESAHDVAGAQAALGADNTTVLIQPDPDEVCAALRQMADHDPPCDNLYFYFTGHGYSNTLVVNDEDDGRLNHDSIANCLKETGIANICTIIDACGQGQWLEAMRRAGVTGVHVTSSDNELAWHANEGEEEHWGMSESGGIYSYYLWLCLSQGLSLPEAHACATDSLNAAFERVIEYLLEQASNAFDSSLVRFRYEFERQKPRIETVAEFTDDDRTAEFQSPPGETTFCIQFSGDVSSDTCRNVTLYWQATADPACPGSVDPWLWMASWNYNGATTPRYFEIRDGTGNYRLRDNSNTRPIRLGVTWPVSYHEPTPSDPPVYPAYSLGWPDGSGAEFTTEFGLGQMGGVYQAPLLSAPYSLCEIPRYLGGSYYWNLMTGYVLLADSDHPELYDYTDPLAPYTGDIVVTVFAEGLFDAEGVPLETLVATLNIYSNETPVTTYSLPFSNTGTVSTPDIRPVAVTLPPIGTGRLDIELAMISSGTSLPDILGLDAIVVDFHGPRYSSCCVGRVGDANGSGDDEPTIGDISIMIDALFIGGDPSVISCLAEADINQSGAADPMASDITIGDISYLIDYLFITGASLGLPDCL